MEDIFKSVMSDLSKDIVAIDKSHALFIVSSIISKKPDNILELGIGSGYITRCLLQSISFNGKGNLTCVDNLNDWQGKIPQHIEELKNNNNIRIIISDEKEFVTSCPPETYDFIVSDGNHFGADKYVQEVFRISKENSFIFFHDTSNSGFPNLSNITKFANDVGYYNYEFDSKSRQDERTERGLLYVIKKRNPK